MKIIVASDSFKGTLTSLEIAELFKASFVNRDDITPLYLPIADGGEGSLDAVSYVLEGKFVTLETSDPYFNKIRTRYFIDRDGNAYIETASTAGLPLITHLNPLLTTTYGLGEQIKDAVKHGARKIFIFLGGSATNDFGAGLFSALGTKFIHQNGEPFIPTGGTLSEIRDIDNKATEQLLKDAELIGLYDVTNPLYGPEGAAFIYAPQKGASNEDVITLDAGLRHLAALVKENLKKDVAQIPGAGSAGGLGASIVAFGNGTLKQGITEILNLINFKNETRDATYIITGEGKLDEQSFSGKVISGISTLALETNTKVILIVGTATVTLAEAQKHFPNIDKIIETNPNKIPFEEVKTNARAMYIHAIKELLKII